MREGIKKYIVKFLGFPDKDCIQQILRTFGGPMLKLDLLISSFQDCIPEKFRERIKHYCIPSFLRSLHQKKIRKNMQK